MHDTYTIHTDRECAAMCVERGEVPCFKLKWVGHYTVTSADWPIRLYLLTKQQMEDEDNCVYPHIIPSVARACQHLCMNLHL